MTKLAASAALLLAGAGLVACGSSTVKPRVAIVQAIRASAAKSGDSYVKVHSVSISKLDPHYAAAEVWTSPFADPGSIRAWILHRTGSSWRPTSTLLDFEFPVCSAAPTNVRKELTGTASCYPPLGVYTSIPWTRGKTVRLRYCQRPGGPGNFIAASKGVTCRTANFVVFSNRNRCDALASCVIAGFRCRAYWDGRYGKTFQGADHALCADGRRRIEWDGG